MWICFELAINLYQGILMILFLHRRICSGFRTNRSTIALFVFWVWAFLSLYTFRNMSIPDTFVFFIPFIYTVTTRRGTWPQRVFWTLVLGIVFTVTTTLFSVMYMMIWDTSMEELLASSSARMGYVITTNVAITIVLRTLSQIGKPSSETYISTGAHRMFIAFLIMQFFAIELLYVFVVHDVKYESLAITIIVCLFAIVVMTLFLFEMLTRSAEKKYIAEMKLQTLTLSQHHQSEIRAIYNEMLSLQHSFRHQVNLAKQLLREGCSDNAEYVLSSLDTTKIERQFITGCVTADAILTVKRTLAEDNGIDFHFQPYPLQQLPIDEAVFCILLSDILDNAIEGAQRVDGREGNKKYVELQFARSWGMFHIRCTNSMNPDTILKEGERYITSKQNAHRHGIGTESIRSIVNQYDGICDMKENKNTFQIDIMLPSAEECNATESIPKDC